VSDVTVTPSPSPGHYRVEALVWNEAGGEGEISVEIRLQDVSSGRTIQQERQLQLRGRDRVTLVVDVAAPAATYRADVRAEYPPQ